MDAEANRLLIIGVLIREVVSTSSTASPSLFYIMLQHEQARVRAGLSTAPLSTSTVDPFPVCSLGATAADACTTGSHWNCEGRTGCGSGCGTIFACAVSRKGFEP